MTARREIVTEYVRAKHRLNPTDFLAVWICTLCKARGRFDVCIVEAEQRKPSDRSAIQAACINS